MIGDFNSTTDRNDQPVACFAELRGYWEALRSGNRLPRRADLDPRGLKGCLHQTMIAEQIAPGLARLRLAGSVFTDIMGMEVRGMPLSALFDPMARAPLEAILREVFAGQTAATLLLEAERGLGRPALTAQLLLLPMLGEFGEVDLILGALALRGLAGRTPRRFSILHVRREALSDPQPVAKTPVFAVPLTTMPPAAAVPYLRLVK